MTKEVDLRSASGRTPPRLSICSSRSEGTARMRGAQGEIPPRGGHVVLRGSDWHRFLLFCFVRSLRVKEKRGGGRKGKKKMQCNKARRKGRVGVASNVMGEGGLVRGGWGNGAAMGPSELSQAILPFLGWVLV